MDKKQRDPIQHSSTNILTGLANSNVEGDLKVEHQNLEFKTGLLNLAGEAIVFSHYA